MIDGTDFNPMKLIFWVLSAIFVVMTSIGGFAASHLISEVDSIHSELNIMNAQVSANEATAKMYRDVVQYRLDRVEKKIDQIK